MTGSVVVAAGLLFSTAFGSSDTYVLERTRSTRAESRQRNARIAGFHRAAPTRPQHE
jgi:hypothetical protein